MTEEETILSRQGGQAFQSRVEAQLLLLRDTARDMVCRYFKDGEGNPFMMTDDQCDIFNLIYFKITPRVDISAFTRFGKSIVIAFAILCRLAAFPEKWAVVAGNDKQASIIMTYIIEHVFDNDYIKSRYVMPQGESEESIRRYRNKNKMNFVVDRSTKPNLMSEVYITNAKGAMGFGAPNVVHDEAGLTPDTEEALVSRMLGDSVENFYCKVSNRWDSGHLRRTADDPMWFHKVIDWKAGIVQGRITYAKVDEAKREAFFDVLYECKFPPRDTMQEGGWLPLLTKDDIDKALVDEAELFGMNRLGVDVAGEGRNFSVMVHRGTNAARMIYKQHEPDTMKVAESVINLKKKYDVLGVDTCVDKNGVGKGLFDVVAMELEGITGVNAGEKPVLEEDQALYINTRAMMYWRLRDWIMRGGKLVRTEEKLENTWYQLTTIRYQKKLEGRHGKLILMSKEEMMSKMKLPSPDVADALSFTFYGQEQIPQATESDDTTKELFERHGIFPTV